MDTYNYMCNYTRDILTIVRVVIYLWKLFNTCYYMSTYTYVCIQLNEYLFLLKNDT